MTLKRLMAPAIASLVFSGFAVAGEPDTTTTETTKKTTTKRKAKSKPKQTAADNTATNKRDRDEQEVTADQQKNNQTDLDLAAQIRRSIVQEKSLSLYAHNVKIIAQNGVVTLKGPVRTEGEKQIVEQKAADVAGSEKVRSEIEITP